MSEQAGTSTGPDAQRQSDRVRYAYRLRIAGKDTSGKSFDEAGRTEVVTRDGGMVVTALSLSTGSVITLSRNAKTVEARIVGQCGIRNEEYLYGVQFVALPTEPFWDLHFPSEGPRPSAGKMVLQCTQCSRQELLHLSEIEMMVYETMKIIPHLCPVCKIESLWIEPDVLGETSVVSGNEAYSIGPAPLVRRSRTVNDRKHSRVQMKNIRACLHRSGEDDDVVSVINLSRGGIAFMSMIDYVPGTKLEVAVPYTEGGANVFTPARIARVRSRPTADLPGEFGLEYVKH